MAITILWDTIDDASVEQALLSGSRIVRTALVKGLTSATTSSKLALLDAINAAAPETVWGTQFDPAYPYYNVYVAARGIPNTKGTMARLWIHYETPGGGGTPLERFTAEDCGTLVVEPVQKIPGLNELIVCSLDQSDPSLTKPADIPTNVVVTLSHPHVYRSLILYGLFHDRPSIDVLNAANTVNNATWQGLPRGYWRCEPPRVRYSSRDGMYAVSVGFLTKGKRSGDGRDWSSYAIATDPATGLLAKPAGATMTTLLGQSYEYGRRWAHDGIYKAGLYELSDFGTVFGNSFPIGD